MTDTLIILGAGGHGRVVADCALAEGKFSEIVFVDNTPGIVGTQVNGFPVIAASLDDLEADPAFEKPRLHVAIGDNATRNKVSANLIAKGYHIASLRHPSAIIGSNVQVESGVVIMAGAIVQSGTQIGAGVVINTGAQVDHDGRIGAYSHVSPGAILAGHVTIGAQCWIGAGAVIRNGIRIGDHVTVGIGAAVTSNLVGEHDRFGGVPARKL